MLRRGGRRTLLEKPRYLPPSLHRWFCTEEEGTCGIAQRLRGYASDHGSIKIASYCDQRRTFGSWPQYGSLGCATRRRFNPFTLIIFTQGKQDNELIHRRYLNEGIFPYSSYPPPGVTSRPIKKKRKQKKLENLQKFAKSLRSDPSGGQSPHKAETVDPPPPSEDEQNKYYNSTTQTREEGEGHEDDDEGYKAENEENWSKRTFTSECKFLFSSVKVDSLPPESNIPEVSVFPSPHYDLLN